MYCLDIKNLSVLYTLFANCTDTLVHSCLEGHMGQAIVDSLSSPTCAMLVVGDFVYFAGDASCSNAADLVRSISGYCKGDGAIAIPFTEEWSTLITQIYGENCTPFTRYAIHKQEQFDIPKLTAYTQQLPAGYSLAPIDAALYQQCLSNSWSFDLCSQFSTAEDYALRGIGYGVLYQGQLVAGASAYTIYNGGIEIEIDTRKDHRRLGLATACGARLILECLNKGIRPTWDAANLASVDLAAKLGYKLKGPYNAYDLVFKAE